MFDRFTLRFSLSLYDDITSRAFYIVTSWRLSFSSMFAVAVLSFAHDDFYLYKKWKLRRWWTKICSTRENDWCQRLEAPKMVAEMHTEAIIEMLLVSGTGDFIGHWDDCDIRRDAAANHFDSMLVGFNPLVPWSAGFRSVGIWYQLLFLCVTFIAARLFDTKLFCFFFLLIQSVTT